VIRSVGGWGRALGRSREKTLQEVGKFRPLRKVRVANKTSQNKSQKVRARSKLRGKREDRRSSNAEKVQNFVGFSKLINMELRE